MQTVIFKHLEAVVDVPRQGTGSLIAAIARDDPEIRNSQAHRHNCGQLFGAVRGLAAVGVDDHHWLVPAGHCVWIPQQTPHSLQSYGPVRSWSIYVDADESDEFPTSPGTMVTSGLLNEAVLRAASWTSVNLGAAGLRIAQVIIDELQSLQPHSPSLPLPVDHRAVRVANALISDLSDNRRIDEWANWVGAAPRTLSRHFLEETGMTFGQWRQHARLIRAAELLTLNCSIASIALELGYDTTSAFIAMFKRTWGVTPGEYRS